MSQQRKKKEKEEDFLKDQCGDDSELYAFLCHTLYVDPAAAISRSDLTVLIEEAEKNITDEDYGHALRSYQRAVNKAIFAATQNPGERSRYIKVIQKLAPRIIEVIEKVKEKAEDEGLVERARYLGEEIKNYEFLTERIGDVIKISSLYYNERLEKLRETEGQAAIEAEQKERRKDAEG
jgi:hypothetical protein